MTTEISFPPLLDVPPDQLEAQKQHLLRAIRREPKRQLLAWLSAPPFRLRVVLPAAAAICAAVVALVATGTLGGGGATQPARHTGSLSADQSVGGLDVNYLRSGGALSSIAVTLNPNVADASVQLQVVHTDATSAEAYAGKAHAQVVFQEDVSTTTPPAASSPDLSTWSGTLSPSDWSGGCQSGLYQIQYLAIPPGRTFANATKQPGSESGAGEWFSCTGS